jgi:two-component system aerobic respiration control sensor histidine kinase ArcB
MNVPKEERKNNLSFYRLENFIDGIPGSVYWKDTNGLYIGCNNTVIIKGNLGSKDNIIGKSDYDVWPEMADAIRKADTEVMQTDKTLEFEETIILKSGERLYFSSVKSPLKDDNGNIIGVICNSLDITELKQAKQIAESASQAKTQFLALMSHELRIPLTGIISTASMLVDEDITSQEANEFGKIISHSGSYLLSTIDNILDFAKLEANKLELIPTPINLKQLIEEVAMILAASAKEKGLQLTVAYNLNFPQNIVSDSRVIRHILTNLIGNAIKYTEKGSIEVTVTPLIQMDETVVLEIIIEDTGIGIPANKVKFIFDRFSQVDNAYTRKSSRQGTGLGLSIVKKLVELLEGEIHVTSKIGKGSKFHFIAEFRLQNNIDDKTPWERWSELQDKLNEGKS